MTHDEKIDADEYRECCLHIITLIAPDKRGNSDCFDYDLPIGADPMEVFKTLTVSDFDRDIAKGTKCVLTLAKFDGEHKELARRNLTA